MTDPEKNENTSSAEPEIIKSEVAPSRPKDPAGDAPKKDNGTPQVVKKDK